MRKICIVVGARPQFVKLAVVSRVMEKSFKQVIIHTGQHYDYNMSDVFFEEMEIPHPDYNLGISGGTHGEMTGKMIIQLEKVFIKEAPDMLLVFGDTNSTMAAAVAAVKLNIPICHVEAGNRLGTLSNPEEVNRIITDHISKIKLVCTASGLEFLKGEGLSKDAYLVGDPMYDAFLYYSKKSEERVPNGFISLNGSSIELPERFYYMTCHRQENTDTESKLEEILDAMNSLDEKTIYPVHPRNQATVRTLYGKNEYKNIVFIKPVGYLESLYLVNHSKKIVTDSGGLQREAFFAKVPCVTVFDWVGWPETMHGKCNQLAKPNKEDILGKLEAQVIFDADYKPFGDGHSGERIVKHIEDYWND